VGRVWPRHGQRGRPLNSVVRHHVSDVPSSLHPKTIADILEFVHVIGATNDDVARILRLHGVCEYFLERIISNRMPSGNTLAQDERFGFYHKLQIVQALEGLDAGTISALRKLGKLRNRCAHERKASVDPSELIDIGRLTGAHFEVALKDFAGEHREFRALAWALFNNVSVVTAIEIATEKVRIKT
jgi:hypothetical protein